MPKVRKFLDELVAYSHELDPTRPAAIGGCQRGEIDKLGDVAGYNGDGARLFVESRHRQRRHRIRFDHRGPSRQIRARLGRLAGHARRGQKQDRFVAFAVAQRRGDLVRASTTAASPAGISARWAWWIISACRSASGIGIATNICTSRRRRGRAMAFPPR